MFSCLLMEARRSAVDDRITDWRGCEFWQRVPHEVADREMFRRVSSDTTVFGSHGLALQYCNAWMLLLGPAALIFRHSSCLFSIYRFARRTLGVKFGAQLGSLESRSQERFSAIFRAQSKHFRLQHHVFGLHVLLTTDCCP